MVLDVNLLVEQAKSRGEEIKNQVQDWVGRANKKFTEVQDLEKKIPADHRCSCIFCSPDWFSRYQLSKKASSIAKEIGVICGDKNFDDVSLPPPIPEPSPSQPPAPAGHFMSFESTQNTMEDVLKALKDVNNFNIVGVHGMGGVGKTTMVKQVAEKVIREDLFHRVVMATLSQNVAREFQGLPLALVSVAKVLGDKDEEEWEKAARRLKMSVSPNPDHEQKVIECLKLSYDYLRDQGAKLCFFMCCLFPEDHNISKCWQEKSSVFLADAGSGREEWPRPTLEDGFESYTAVSVMFNNIERLPYELIESLPPSIGLLQNLCTLYMDRCKSKDISIFGGLKKLEILSLRKSRIGSIPKELAELSELRMLDMTSCLHMETISPQIISRLQVLEELYLHGSFCQWGGRVEGTSDESNAILEEVINLPRLTILKVDIVDVNCLPLNVNSTPNWKKFDICISRSYFNRQVNEHLSKLNRVPTRTLFIDATMNKLPDWFFEAVTKKAEMLIYSSCDDLIEILTMYNRARLFSLKALHVEQCHNIGCLIPLPEGFPNQPCRSLENSLLQSNMIQRLHNLEMLNVTGNNIKELFGFEGLQEGPHHLRSLKELRLDNLSKLVSIWKGPAQPPYFSNVKIVIVIKCSKLKYVFSHTMSQGLSQLEELWVEDCSDLEEIIQEDGGITMDKIILPQLKCPLLEHLHVRHCPKFRRPEFHSSKQVQFDNERHYNILKKSQRFW
uniref:NB-ARC domain-containing protein n=1 Tax=Quercus lobata TaxID=97700 RepID=A0A7N2RD18_QUELO